MAAIRLTFEPERETKGTYRFQEHVDKPDDEPRIGNLYVRKAALKELGWESGKPLTMELQAGNTES